MEDHQQASVQHEADRRTRQEHDPDANEQERNELDYDRIDLKRQEVN